MRVKNKSGFTLIELLVVITIIGILATGATAVYTSQIQKARDTTRINDMKALQNAIEQVYQDRSEYPPSGSYFLVDSGATAGVAVKTYMPKVPKDPKNGQTCNNGSTSENPTCAYAYTVVVDDNGINKGAFALTTAFESEGKVTTDAKKDGGKLQTRWETGNALTLKVAKSTTVVPYNSRAVNCFKSASGVTTQSCGAVSDKSWDTQNQTIIINGG